MDHPRVTAVCQTPRLLSPSQLWMKRLIFQVFGLSGFWRTLSSIRHVLVFMKCRSVRLLLNALATMIAVYCSPTFVGLIMIYSSLLGVRKAIGLDSVFRPYITLSWMWKSWRGTSLETLTWRKWGWNRILMSPLVCSEAKQTESKETWSSRPQWRDSRWLVSNVVIEIVLWTQRFVRWSKHESTVSLIR